MRPAVFAPHVVDIGADAVSKLVVLTRQGLVAPDDRLGPAQVDHDVAILGAFHDATHNLAHAIFIFFVLPLALGLAHLLHDDLLGVLRRNTAKVERWQWLCDEITHLCLGVTLFCVLEADFGCVERHFLHDFQKPRQLYLTGACIDLRADLIFASVAGFGRFLDRVFHRRKHERAVDRLFARDRIRDLQEFQAVCANSDLRHRSTPNP